MKKLILAILAGLFLTACPPDYTAYQENAKFKIGEVVKFKGSQRIGIVNKTYCYSPKCSYEVIVTNDLETNDLIVSEEVLEKSEGE